MRACRVLVACLVRFGSAALLALALAVVPAASAAPAHAAASNVRISDNAYDPTAVTIAVGDSVIWRNSGQVAHTVTSEVRIFDSGSIAAGNSYELIFRTPGTYYYYCTIHPQMRGRVVVGRGFPMYGTGRYGAGTGAGPYGYGAAASAFRPGAHGYGAGYGSMMGGYGYGAGYGAGYPGAGYGYAGLGQIGCPYPYGYRRYAYPGQFCRCW